MRPIKITEPHLPSRAVFDQYLDEIWDRNWLTNNGPVCQQFERKLVELLGVTRLSFVSNGTIAIQLALEALKVEGEVLTTAFSFVATASSVAWQKMSPRMVDVDPHTLNIDPIHIRKSVTSRTRAILATHVFGNPCDVVEIEHIAREYGIPVIYDGAHAFGSRYMGRSLLSYGDVATASFHATKLFHTVEGGAVICRDAEVADRIVEMRNFGLRGEEIGEIGVNGKNSEIHAAMGLANLREFSEIVAKRKSLSSIYDERFQKLPVRKPETPPNFEYNYAYYPVILANKGRLNEAMKALNDEGVFPRRYFYPSLSTASYVDKGLGTPIADDVSERVLCLPLHTHLSEGDVMRVAGLLCKSLSY